jgi:dihydropyrimidinase
MYDKVIANGTIVTETAAYPADVGVSGERIEAVGVGLQGEQIIDAAGCYVIPGGVDVHVHLQMSVGQYTSSDTFESGTAAAACGGTTTVVDFVEPKGDQPMMEALAARRAAADPQVAIDYGLHMTIPAWHADHALGQITEVMAAGVYSFKLYQAYGPLCLDDVRLYAALQALGEHGGLPILHSENGPVIDRMRAEAVAAGRLEPIWHARTRPTGLEGEAVGRALELARLAQSPLYIVHVSCADSLARILSARHAGEMAYGETCPQYLFLTAERLTGEHSERFICAPPLREAADQESLWRALARGDLQVVSTDHCPFTAAEKAAEADFTRIPGGLPSIEARLALIHHAVRQGWMDLTRWVGTCCTAPARLFRLPDKGHIAPGYDADLVVFDPERQVELSAGWLHERVDWSPYEGMALRGWPREVMSRGEVIVREGEYLGEAGRGRFIRAGCRTRR